MSEPVLEAREVGRSFVQGPSTIFGCVTSARATAARWRSPPESWWGLCVSRPPSPTRSSSSRALARASATLARRTSSGMATFSSAENSGSRWWNW